MTQEYVTVQAPEDRRPTKPRKPAAERHRRRRLVAVALAIAAVMWAVLGVMSMDGSPIPTPQTLPAPMEHLPDGARSTALVYQEWTVQSEFVECLRGIGFNPEAPVIEHSERLEPAAHHLDVKPGAANPQSLLPMLLPQDVAVSQSDGLATGESEQCTKPDAQVDTSDAAAVSAVVEQARGDDEFLAMLSERVWAQQNPAEVTHQASLLRHDDQPAGAGMEDPDAWSEQLAVVTGAIQDGTVWVPIVTSHTQDFGQSVGLVDSGGAVAVRVTAGDLMIDEGTYTTSSDFIRCGPITMSAGVHEPWGLPADLQDVMQGMATACNALIGAGFAQAQTLAEVYWD